MIRALHIFLLRFRADSLRSQIADGEGLLRDHRLRVENCQAELSTVERRLYVARMRGHPQSLINQALKRRTA